MTDQQPETEVDEPAGPPRWVTGIVVAVMILLFVVLHLIIGGVGRTVPAATAWVMPRRRVSIEVRRSDADEATAAQAGAHGPRHQFGRMAGSRRVLSLSPSPAHSALTLRQFGRPMWRWRS